jgi:hypothetical protein
LVTPYAPSRHSFLSFTARRVCPSIPKKEAPMAKLSLKLDDIRVHSFSVDPRMTEDDKGTVRAFAASAPFNSCVNSCNLTCSPSYCIASCLQTCKITCGDCLSVEICY